MLCETYHFLRSSEPVIFEEVSSSTDVAANAVIAPGKPRPSQMQVNAVHAKYAHTHERLLKATAHKSGVALTGNSQASKGCALC